MNREHLALAEPQAVVINSGVANAATGERGKLDALATAAEAARLLDLDVEEVLVLSTGVIGARLPLHKLLPALDPAVAGLAEDGGPAAAEAIMTTDTVAKEAVVSRGGFTVGGMAKGSGMIHPDLATMLAVVTTDYPLEPGEAIEFLRPAVEQTFNAISVDGEPSTNDCVILLANGASGVDARRRGVRRRARRGLRRARAAGRRRRRGDHGARRDQRVRRGRRRAGEGDRAPDRDLAAREDRALRPRRELGPRADGRRLRAVERRLRDVEPERITLRYNGTVVLDRGAPTGVEPDVAGPSCTIDLDLGLGDGTAGYLTSDLSYDYVRINADYRT